jgi:hypothetical protein
MVTRVGCRISRCRALTSVCRITRQQMLHHDLSHSPLLQPYHNPPHPSCLQVSACRLLDYNKPLRSHRRTPCRRQPLSRSLHLRLAHRTGSLVVERWVTGLMGGKWRLSCLDSCKPRLHHTLHNRLRRLLGPFRIWYRLSRVYKGKVY